MNATTTIMTDEQNSDRAGVNAPQALVSDLVVKFGDAARQADHDAGKDQQRHAVADAALGDLLAQPHDEGAAGSQGQHRHQDEADARGSTTKSPAVLQLKAMPNDWIALRMTVR